MFNLPNAEPERSAAAETYYAVGRAMLSGLAMYGAGWAPAPPIVPLTRSPKPPATPEAVPVVVPSRPRAPRLSFMLRRRTG